jgi:hypothetical protein
VIVGRRDVRKEVEAELVTQMARRFGQARRVDDEGRLAVGLANLDEPGDAVVAQLATPRSS